MTIGTKQRLLGFGIGLLVVLFITFVGKTASVAPDIEAECRLRGGEPVRLVARNSTVICFAPGVLR